MAGYSTRCGLALVSLLVACGKSAPPPADAAATTAAADASAPPTASPPTREAAPDAAPAPADVAPAPADAAPAPTDAAAAPADAATTVAGKTVLEIDAGPEAGAAFDLTKLPGLPAEVAKKLCDATRESAYMACDDDDKKGCGCTFVKVGLAGPRETALLHVTASVIPGTTEAYVLMQQEGDTWKPMAEIGVSDSGMRGDNGLTTTVHHVGAADLAAAGHWVWVDAMREQYNIETGTTWTRMLWLCGGTEAAACHGVPLKSWWSPKIKGLEDLQKEAGLPSQPADLKKFALAATLDEQGALTVTGKTEVPGELQALIGKHPLASLGGLKGVMPATLPERGEDKEP